MSFSSFLKTDVKRLPPLHPSFSGAALALILIVFYAGSLAPWTFYGANDARWMAGRNGVNISKQGFIYSPEPFNKPNENIFADGVVSIEVYFQRDPQIKKTQTTFFCFNNEMEKPRRTFFIKEYSNSLIIQNKLLMNALPEPGEKMLITITSNKLDQYNKIKEPGAIYLNGEKTTSFSYPLFLYYKSAPGHLVLGNNARGTEDWTGNILGVGIYKRNLTKEKVKENYEYWANGGHPSPFQDKSMICCYAFDEGEGDQVYNHAGPYNHLLIPQNIPKIVAGNFLDQRWNRWRTLDWDMINNFLFYILPGFFITAYLSKYPGLKDRANFLYAIGICGIMSLSIEMLQHLLPRHSNLEDLICNTLGAALGAGLYTMFFKNYASRGDIKIRTKSSRAGSP